MTYRLVSMMLHVMFGTGVTGPRFNIKMSSYQYRKSHYSTMGFPMPVRRHLFIESATWFAERRRAGMFTHTRSWRRRICRLLRTQMVWSTQFQSGRGKLGVGPNCCGADFVPAPPPLRDRVCENACNDLCWTQFSARVRSVHVWLYLYSGCQTPCLTL